MPESSQKFIERFPERIRIDRPKGDSGHYYGPYSGDRINGRSDMESCIYVRADQLRGAVAAIDDAVQVILDALAYLPPDSARRLMDSSSYKAFASHVKRGQ